MLSQWAQRAIQSKAELDGQHPGGAVLGQVRESLEGLPAGGRCLVGRGALGSAGSGLLAVGDSLVPYLASQGVMGQAFYLLVPPVAGQRFERLDNPGMQRPAPLQEEASIRHLLESWFVIGVVNVC
jgi:hypothetical protein